MGAVIKCLGLNNPMTNFSDADLSHCYRRSTQYDPHLFGVISDTYFMLTVNQQIFPEIFFSHK